ncbi:MAG: nucleotidyltransferase family protein, partial [Betaproteobacteria bacterium]|nr:nucleotidyltransferase family protein [Betaproteobacteria bacterium]
DGTPMVLASATRLRAVFPDVLVVLRPGDGALGERLQMLDCRVVINPEAEAGLGNSLATGVRASADAAGWLVALADMPYIANASYQAVRARLLAGASLVVPVVGGQRGHPVGFSRDWQAELSRLDGDVGARHILRDHPDRLELLAVDDPGILADVDRPNDLDRNGALS